jgi:hypothetical protein
MALPIGGLALQLLCGPAGTTRTWLLSSRAARTKRPRACLAAAEAPRLASKGRHGCPSWLYRIRLEGRHVPAEHRDLSSRGSHQKSTLPFARVQSSHLCALEMLVCRSLAPNKGPTQTLFHLIACPVLHFSNETCSSERLSPEEIYIWFLLSCYARGTHRALQIGLDIGVLHD